MNTDNLIIATVHPEFAKSALQELQQIDSQIRFVEEMADGITLYSVSNSQQFMRRVANQRPTFVRHLAPAQDIVQLANTEQDLGTIAIALAELPGFSLLSKGTRFAVQARFVQSDRSLGERPFSTGQLNRALAEALAEETEAIEYIKKPEVIISLLCTMQKCYLGISTPEENLSSWPGGARHYAQTDDQVSRAEFKLLEALEVFGITLPDEGRILDLGAAPGGWSRLLLEAGLEVYAVDPARLDPRLEQDEALQHYRGYAEDFIEEAIERQVLFDAIVNDMRMDAREAARLLCRAVLCLHDDGFIVSVFKLPHETLVVDPLRNLKEALRILSTSYGIIQTKQLFHNRQEVTVVAAQPIRSRKK
ncbi:SAM-dependent methyltransferase [Tengunoibacter tsumagoiensis]|uniref:SAM-dependent methyltransferase n=1 Tax=Tengunoibacter tsumagoiensis TaxID=2014871 RepID=UPI0013866726|nr:SAM-dependent methyltransferase [Tengunoibacter tsumagoiensis]